MADTIKAQKLAAARKRLKEYQKIQSNRKTVTNQENVDILQKNVAVPSENITPTESMVSSTHSTIDHSTVDQNLSENHDLYDKISEAQEINNSKVDAKSNTSFFNNTLFQTNESNNTLSNYFDISLNSGISNSDDFTQHFDTTVQSNIENNLKKDGANQIIAYAVPFEPEIRTDFVPTTEQSILSNDTTVLENIEQCSVCKSESNEDITRQQLPERQTAECALEENLQIDSSVNQNVTFSNTEYLRQLSSKLNSLIDNETVQNISSTGNLEERNQELASLLRNEQLKTEQLNLQLREYQTRITQLETEMQQIKNEYDTKLSLETGPLQEQLQYHVQTVGILVGEKTELTMALNQSQTTAKQKTAECEELQGRLKASRHRVAELEKEVNYLKSTKENFDKHEQENNREVEKLKLEYNLLNEQLQDTSEECSELRQKLNTKMNECLVLQQEIQDKNSQLSLAQLKLQQLTNGENIQMESQLEIVNQQKISLEQQIAELTQTVKVISSERDQANQQYQQYVQQLNGQIHSLAENLETKNIENDNLSKREQSLIKHIGELEKHMQNLQNERQTFVHKNDDTEIKKLGDTIQTLQDEKNELELKYKEEIEKHNEFYMQMQQKDQLIMELESMIEQLKDQPDASKLVAAMESDKVAAARAVEQNKKLKEQLEELHEGFIQMSNSKLELTEKLQSEQYQSKDLSEKLVQATTAVEHLHSVIATKDKELTEIQNETTELQKQILQQSQLTDRLRHYEARGNASEFLQQELQQAKQIVEKLTNENSILITKLNAASENINDNSNNVGVNELEEKVMELEKENFDLNEKLKSGESDSIKDVSQQYLDKEKAMERLEERFKKTMTEVANLTEEKQRLEHLVLQLQSETETIGEYVTLYQCQRAMLKEKTLEKDEQLKRLARDREEMKLKLDELNTLIQKLVIEKDILPKELLHHNLLQNLNDVCEVHKEDKISTENKTKDNIVNGGENIDNNNENYGTAGKIIALLSEIQTSNLVQPSDNIQNFHPCPWCSGQLITV